MQSDFWLFWGFYLHRQIEGPWDGSSLAEFPLWLFQPLSLSGKNQEKKDSDKFYKTKKALSKEIWH